MVKKGVMCMTTTLLVIMIVILIKKIKIELD